MSRFFKTLTDKIVGRDIRSCDDLNLVEIRQLADLKITEMHSAEKGDDNRNSYNSHGLHGTCSCGCSCCGEYDDPDDRSYDLDRDGNPPKWRSFGFAVRELNRSERKKGIDPQYAHPEYSNYDLGDVELPGCSFTVARFERCNLKGSSFRGGSITSAQFNESCLRNANMRGLRVTGLDIRGADLRGADLSGLRATVIKVNSKTNLSGAIGLDSVTATSIDGRRPIGAHFTHFIGGHRRGLMSE